MTESILIEVSPEERALREAYREHGVDQAIEYLHMLATADKLVAAIERDDPPDEEEDPNWREDLRQGFIDAMTGDTRPIEDLWKELEDDATDTSQDSSVL